MSLFISGFLLTFLVWLFAVTISDGAWRQQNRITWLSFSLAVAASLLGAATFAYSYHEARDFRDPKEVGRLIVGMLLAVIVVLWLLRRQAGYNDHEAAVQAARPLPQRLDASLEAKWVLLLVATLLLVVLFLPHIDRIVDNMQEFKAGSVELKLSVEQGSGNRESLQHALEQTYIGYFNLLSKDKALLDRLESDRRIVGLIYSKVEDQKRATAAIDSFQLFYTATIVPVVNCAKASLAAGADVSALRLDIGAIAHDLAAMLMVKEKAKADIQTKSNEEKTKSVKQTERIAMLAKHAGISISRITQRRDCEPTHGAAKNGRPVLPPKDYDSLVRSGWTHFVVGALFGFAENPIQATRYLEGISSENLNVQAMLMLATYWDALDQREKSIGHLNQALMISERNLRVTCDKAGESSNAGAQAKWTKDVERWERAVALHSNALAYIIARSRNIKQQESRAFRLSRYAIVWYQGKFRMCTKIKQSMQVDELQLGGAVDTFAYLVLASEVATRRPNQDYIECAQAVFENLRDQELKNFNNVAEKELNSPDGRINFELARLTLNIMQGHVQLAARALRGREPKCSTEDRIRMEDGKLRRD